MKGCARLAPPIQTALLQLDCAKHEEGKTRRGLQDTRRLVPNRPRGANRLAFRRGTQKTVHDRCDVVGAPSAALDDRCLDFLADRRNYHRLSQYIGTDLSGSSVCPNGLITGFSERNLKPQWGAKIAFSDAGCPLSSYCRWAAALRSGLLTQRTLKSRHMTLSAIPHKPRLPDPHELLLPPIEELLAAQTLQFANTHGRLPCKFAMTPAGCFAAGP